MIRFFTDNPIQLSISELLGRAKWKLLQFEILFDRTHIRSKSCSTICTFARYMVHGYDQTRIHNTRINIVFTRANERYLIIEFAEASFYVAKYSINIFERWLEIT